MKKYKVLSTLVLALCIIFLNGNSVKAAELTDAPMSFYDGNTTKDSTFWYVGNYCGVDLYGVTYEQFSYLAPYIQLATLSYDLTGLSIAVSNTKTPLQQIIAFGDGQYDLSQNVCHNKIKDNMAEYRPNGDIILIRGDANPVHQQLAMLHEIGHRVDFKFGTPSSALTWQQIESLRICSSAWGLPSISTPEQYNAVEAFADLVSLQTIGLLPK